MLSVQLLRVGAVPMLLTVQVKGMVVPEVAGDGYEVMVAVRSGCAISNVLERFWLLVSPAGLSASWLSGSTTAKI